ncbi:aspartic proteinase 36-like [Mercurialis annua]|uniref:aspartic proteinase 36-like n=1 Tax=Mercurialis annua TaxID=3986 RepID=UPI002160AE2E|nr:aspartic proteinase 36-like [Mercurialis annua]
MASPLIEFTVVFFIFHLHVITATAAHSVSTDSPSSAATVLVSGGKPAMVLPLFLSRPNLTKTTSDSLMLRRLQGSKTKKLPNARMRLYDDLLLNGYYTTRLWIGTPPQEFALIVDTGSTVTYVPCATCEQCGTHQDPKFQPDLSSTYQAVKCNIDCTCDDEKEQCVYERRYAELSTSSGVIGEDIISFGNQSELVPQRAVFGCENVETGDLYSQRADGIIGLGRGDLSIVDQLVDKHVISDSFSLCYGGMDIGGGAMILGGISSISGMVFAESDPMRSQYYNIDLKAINVAGKKLPLNPTIFDGRSGTVLDSGTTYAYLPEAAFIAFKDALMKELNSLKQIHGPDPNYNDICFSGAESDVSQLSKTFPTVDLVFGNGQKFSLSPENYLFRHSKVHGAYCLGVFQNGHDPTTLLGGIVVRNTLVMYDRENSKMGFWKTNCSELWERHHIADAPSPLPSALNRTDLIAPPTLSPSGSGHYDLPDEYQIGQITFEILVNANSSALKLHSAELVKFISQELGANISQVRSLTLASRGNGSLVGWTIVPSGSANYISTAAALSMISRVAERQMQLPDTSGNYQFVSWKIKPPVNRNWWQQHFLLVVLAIIVMVVIIGLSAVAIWLIRRWNKSSANAYKPVNAETPEQELQPL